jgi:flagellar biosynthesis/type III secretory pathway ATPase
LKALAEQIVDLDGVEVFGRVVGVRGLMVEIAGPLHAMSVGSRLTIETGQSGEFGRAIACEVVGLSGANALAMPVRRARRHVARLPRGAGILAGRSGPVMPRPSGGGGVHVR